MTRVRRQVLYLVLVAVLVLLVAVPGASAAPAASPESAAGCWYRVRWGDTLAKIAGSYGTSVSYLVSINGLPNANRIWAGQWLRVPCTVHPGRTYFWSAKYGCWGYSYWNAWYGRFIFICQ